MNKPLLIIGKPNSSKTSFVVQFYIRLLTKKSSLTLYKPVENISAIKEASDLLANGEGPKTTPVDKNIGLLLPIQFGEKQVDLYCPDYGGEQINNIINNREVDKKWSDSIKESDNWILFIRLSSLKTSFDLSNKTINPDILKNNSGQEQEYAISDQSAFIELLQIMLHVKGHDYHFKNCKTKLTVVLTCWDELETKDIPREKLLQYLPLLLNFIESNWDVDKINIVGLSALGFSLNKKENQKKYQIEGSENFGYLIKSAGTKTKGITELISVAL